MDPLVTTALVGTAQRGSPDLDAGMPVDALARELPPGDAERALLLRAGCMAAYTHAGTISATLPELPEPAPDERLPTCPHAASDLLRRILGENPTHRDELLLEAFQRIARAGRCLPHDLLPAALNLRTPELRATLVPIAGARGRWLSRLNPDWSWLADELGGRSDIDQASAATIWQEGTTSERVAVLRRLRESDPAAARDWLAAVWKRERAEVRAKLVGAFEVGLTLDDEPLLESALDDRSVEVRSVAASLLARLPGSALAARMRARADTLLSFVGGTLEVTPPTTLDNDAKRDGIPEKSPSGGERAWWLMHILARVPLSLWQERFQAPPDQIVAALESSEWQAAAMEGFTHSAVSFATREWAMPLLVFWWVFWTRQPQSAWTSLRTPIGALFDALSPLAPALDLEVYARTLTSNDSWAKFVGALPVPWSDDFGAFYLARLRDFVTSLAEKDQDFGTWDLSISRAAIALPPACFAAALVPFDPIKDKSWQAQQFTRQLDNLVDTIRLRRRILEVISL